MYSLPQSLSRLCLQFPKSLSRSRPKYLRTNRRTASENHSYRRGRTLVTPGSIVSNMEGTAGLVNCGGSSADGVMTASNGVSEEAYGVVRFPMSPSSAFVIQKGDIARWFIDGSSDAIVNPANECMLGGGGADGAIHSAAGPELLAACYNVPEVRPGVRCPTGEARITPGFRLPASHVIHTVGPIYNANANPEESLRSAYRNSLRVAKDNNIQYVAFPAISCGVYRYPFDEAATIAITTTREFADDFKEVHFVLFSDDIYNVWLNKANKLLRD